MRKWTMRLAALMLALCLLVPAAALAEYYYMGPMYVVNCSDWVSLRYSPSTSASRIAKVPLGTAVEAWLAPESNDFYYVEVSGYSGYILKDYLAAASDDYPYAGLWDYYAGDSSAATLRWNDANYSRSNAVYGSLYGVPYGLTADWVFNYGGVSADSAGLYIGLLGETYSSYGAPTTGTVELYNSELYSWNNSGVTLEYYDFRVYDSYGSYSRVLFCCYTEVDGGETTEYVVY